MYDNYATGYFDGGPERCIFQECKLQPSAAQVLSDSVVCLGGLCGGQLTWVRVMHADCSFLWGKSLIYATLTTTWGDYS